MIDSSKNLPIDHEPTGSGIRTRESNNSIERRGWRIVAVLFLTLVFGSGGAGSFGVFFTPLVKEFGWSHLQTSLLFSVSALAMGAAQPLVGLMLDKIDARIVIVSGMLVELL